MRALVGDRLADPAAERVLASHAAAIREIQDLPASSIRIIPNVVLPNGVRVAVPHRLGRRPRMVVLSAIRVTTGTGSGLTVGVVRDYGDIGGGATGLDPIDRSQIIVLQPGGFTLSITVDVMVM
jgi:hypothetical protein